MRILCPACHTENPSDATVCSHCAAALPLPTPTVQRLSLLEQAMAKPAPTPIVPPIVPPVAPSVSPSAPVKAAAEPLPPAATIQPPYTMPPLPAQPHARRRSRAPWVLAAVLLVALLCALTYEQLHIRGVSLPSMFTARP